MHEDREGNDALIHLRVPAAVKARWVAQSRREGKRLTDWIIERVERTQEPIMQVYKVPESLADKYHGAGHALAAAVKGHLIDLIYIEDVLPDYDPDVSGALQAAITDERLGPAVRRLQALGEVSIGMCSSWEFVVL